MTFRATAAGLLVATTLLLGACSSRTGGTAAPERPSPAPDTTTGPTSDTTSDTTADDPCGYREKPGEAAPAGLPDRDAVASSVLLATSAGDMLIALAPEEAPCTVRSFVHLARKGFYDGTTCHRLTTSPGLKVLQCGDPNGDGTGGPGYTIPDELPTDLSPAPADTSGQGLVVYPRGTVAMANAGPDTGGSQFFLVYGDSTIPPAYAVFGEVDADALAVLDTVAQAGVTPGNSPEDGAPKVPVVVRTATAG